MGKLLVITEKPSVARDVCEALGGFEDHGGEYWEGDHHVVTFALGHLLELAEPEDYREDWKGWTLASLPMIPDRFELRPREGQKKRLDLIRKLGRRPDVEGVVNACDAGREGEIIYRRIVEHTGLTDLPQHRLWLQSMTDEAIRTAFASLLPGRDFDALGDAAWLRSVGDWLVGMNATRALTKRLKGRKEKGAWSAGRVQTPTLGLLVRRERDLLAHVPRTFWEILGGFAHAGQVWEGRYHDPTVQSSEDDDRDVRPSRIFDRARGDAVLAAARAAATAPASERRKKSRQNPPLPFDLTSLQREANRRFSFSAKRTLNAAQRLYEQHKVLTYPRTDCRHLPDDYGPTVSAVLGELGRDVTYRGLSAQILAEGPQNLDRVLDGTKVSDHFAIVPTGQEPPDSLSGDDARIYDLVVRQFLAAFLGPATWDVVEREVVVQVPGGTPAHFRTSARSLEVPGFLAALGQEEGSGNRLPALVPGRDEVDGVAVQVESVRDEEKETRPPGRYSEGQVLRLMETAGELVDDEDLAEALEGRGLGTPATRADIIENLVEKGYARRVDGRLGATPKGMRLIDVLERANVPVLASAELTGQWENQLHKVQQGQVARTTALANITEFTRSVTESLKGFEHERLWASDPPLGRCPSCGRGDVVESSWGYRCTRNTIDDDGACRFFVWKDRFGRYVDRGLVERLLRDRYANGVVGFVDRFGHALEGRVVLEAEENEPGGAWTVRVELGAQASDAKGAPTEEVVGDVLTTCPCGEADCAGVVETSRRYVCQRVLDHRARQGPELPKVVCLRPLDVEEARAFFDAGRTPMLEGFTSKRNRPFSGALVRKPNGRYGFEFPERPGGERKGRFGRGAAAAAEPTAAPPSKRKSPAARKSPASREPASAARKPAARKTAAHAEPAAAADGEVPAVPTKRKAKASSSRRAAPSATGEA